MHSSTSLSAAIATERELHARAHTREAVERRRRGDLRIRPAVEADTLALVRLARLDSSRPPTGTILVAEDAGEIVAAISAEDGATIANPFRATGAIVSMLRLRSEQIHGTKADRPRPPLLSLRRLRARSAAA